MVNEPRLQHREHPLTEERTFIFQGCHSKALQSRQLETTETSLLAALEPGVFNQRINGDMLPLPASRSCFKSLAFLACCCVSQTSASIVSWPSTLCMSLSSCSILLCGVSSPLMTPAILVKGPPYSRVTSSQLTV